MQPPVAARSGTRARRGALRLLVSAVVIVALVRIVPWTLLSESLRRVPLTTFALVLAGFLACHALGVVKWRLVIGVAGARLPARAAVECYAAGLFSNLFLPTIVGGDVLRALLAGRRSGRLEAAVLGGAADRVLDVTALGALALAASLAVGLGGTGAESSLLLVGCGGALVAAAAVVPLLVRTPLRRWPPRLRRRVARVLIALRRQRRRPGVLLASFAGACAMQGALALLNAVLGRALAIEADLASWFFAWSLAKAAGLLPVSFNGIGVRDSAFAFLLVPRIDNAGISDADRWARAIACSLVWQAVLIAGGLVAGAVWRALRHGMPPGDRAADRAPPPRAGSPVPQHV